VLRPDTCAFDLPWIRSECAKSMLQNRHASLVQVTLSAGSGFGAATPSIMPDQNGTYE
jgi:hypothetical protein